MQIIQTRRFKKSVKKLHENQKESLDEAVMEILQNPFIGEAKKGDLAGVYIHKFIMLDQRVLLAYTHSEREIVLLALGSHENFYRNLKT